MHPSTARHTALPLVLSFFALSSDGHGQSDTDVAARRVLIEQAQHARQSGDHARALEFASRAVRIQSAAWLRLFIAEEQDALQQLPAALGSTELCLRDAGTEPATRMRSQVEARCRTLGASIRSRVGFVTVAIENPSIPGLHVEVDGNTLSDALYGVAAPVSPGTVSITASAPGFAPFRRSVQIAPGATQPVRVQLAPAPATTSAPAPVTRVAAARGTCTATIVVAPPRGSSATCTIDAHVTAAPGTLTYPCDGGAADLSFGTSHFTGAVEGGVLDVGLSTRFDFTDGCHWQSSQAIHGTVASGQLVYSYSEAPLPGQRRCAPACTARSNATVR